MTNRSREGRPGVRACGSAAKVDNDISVAREVGVRPDDDHVGLCGIVGSARYIFMMSTSSDEPRTSSLGWSIDTSRLLSATLGVGSA